MRGNSIYLITTMFCFLGSGLFASDPSFYNRNKQVATSKPAPPESNVVVPSNQLSTSTPTIAKFLEPGIYSEVDLLIWQAYNRYLEFATSSSTTSVNSNVIRPDSHYNAGFRLGLGYKMPHGNWDVFARWTWFTDTAGNSVSSDAGMELIPLLAYDPIHEASSVSSASQSWKMSLNALDIGVGAPIVHLPSLINFRTYLGLRAIWIDQKNTAEYEGGDLTFEYSPDTSIYNEHYWGIGLRTGLTSYFWISEYFDFWGNLLFSTISGNFDTKIIEKSGPSELVTTSSHDKYFGMVPIAELDVGFIFKYPFLKNTKLISLGIAWSQAFIFEEWINAGALVIEGVTISARLDF